MIRLNLRALIHRKIERSYWLKISQNPYLEWNLWNKNASRQLIIINTFISAFFIIIFLHFYILHLNRTCLFNRLLIIILWRYYQTIFSSLKIYLSLNTDFLRIWQLRLVNKWLCCGVFNFSLTKIHCADLVAGDQFSVENLSD